MMSDMRSYVTMKPSALKIVVLAFCLLSSSANGHILVYRRSFNQLIEEFNDMPANFGGDLSSNGLKVFAYPASPIDGCEQITPPYRSDYPPFAKFAAIIERGGLNCSFELKVRNAQTAFFDAVIVYNNRGDDLEQMSAQNRSGIHIPSVFVGHSTGTTLRTFMTADIVLVINDELPFNINTQLILPFCILIGICFLIMLFYMVYKCIREQRRLRRHRLPKRLLKKLPILKYSKNNDLCYDTCVICLEEFVDGDKLRVLPCRHPYHTQCIDPWLTENRRVCPICKRKVFTKGEARSIRNRQSSLDSVTDTDDDTTPLLHPPTDNPTVSARLMPEAANAVSTANRDSTTRHGTFNRHNANVPQFYEASSDEENVLGVPQTVVRNQHRINPFDRRPNLPADEVNDNRLTIWNRFTRFFNFQQEISVSAPPFIEEGDVETEDVIRIAAASRPDTRLAQIRGDAEMPPTSSNNTNDNASGSYKIDDESPPHTIYEPIVENDLVTNNPTVEQFGPQGGPSVISLPIASSSSVRSDRRNHDQFLI